MPTKTQTKRRITHPAQDILRRRHPGRQEPNSYHGLIEPALPPMSDLAQEPLTRQRVSPRGFGHRLPTAPLV